MFKIAISLRFLDIINKPDQVYSNTLVPTQVNTNQHESDTNQHKSNTSQHESDTTQYESTLSLACPTNELKDYSDKPLKQKSIQRL